jgi:hypothetical protein
MLERARVVRASWWGSSKDLTETIAEFGRAVRRETLEEAAKVLADSSHLCASEPLREIRARIERSK